MALDVLRPADFKGLPLGSAVCFDELGATGWNITSGDTATPVAVLREAALRQNSETMRRYCSAVSVELAPHAKTTLSPELVALQREHGAWAMTAALPRQVAALWAAGVPRVLMANELTDPAAARWLRAELDRDPEKELWCYVDSVAGVDLLDRALSTTDEPESHRQLSVLIEMGHNLGRTGCRTREAAIEVAERALASETLRVAGVAGYEGTLGTTRDDATLARADQFVRRLAETAEELAAHGLLDDTEPALITAGGSIFFDRVAEGLADWSRNSGGRVVLRSGCYLIHDHGMYAKGTPATREDWDLPTFVPALEVWSRVVSRPEPGLVLLDAGRRDLSFDAGLPVPLRWCEPIRVAAANSSHSDTAPIVVHHFDERASIEALSDQHAFLSVPTEGGPAVGDLVGLGISHPCTTLDRWRVLLLVDEAYTVVGGVQTIF